MLRSILAGVVLITASFVLIMVLTEVGTEQVPGSTEQTHPAETVVAMPPEPQTLATLTSTEENHVGRIALKDPRVLKILEDRPHRVSEVGEWTGLRGALIGGVAVISLGSATTVAGEWLESSWLDWETEPLPPPVIVSYQAEYSGVTEIHVLVDLGMQQVKGIIPFSHDGVHIVGSREFTGEHNAIQTCRRD